jgi:hypothetical protein
MRLLGRFSILLLAMGLGLGWWARRRWGPLRGAAPWVVLLGAAPLHALVVAVRGATVGVGGAPLAVYGAASLALLAAAALAARWSMRRRPRVASVVPLAQALLQALATTYLGAPFAAAGAAPPGLGSALVVGFAVVALGALWIWAPPAAGGGRFGWLRRSGRLRT